MLVTRRRVGEALVIGDSIEVHVLEISQGRVKLGVAAPAELRVERKEWRIVSEQNRSASAASNSEFVKRLIGASESAAKASGEDATVVGRTWRFAAPEDSS